MRGRAMAAFLARNGWGDAACRLLADDASFRRYLRVAAPDAATPSAVLMDAPPGREDIRPFMAIAGRLTALGLSAPRILAADAGEGFLLLEDLGDDTFSRLLADGGNNAPGLEDSLYELATDTLIALHRRHAPAMQENSAATADDDPPVPPYDMARLLDEVALFTDWCWPALTDAPCPPDLRAAFLAIWQRALAPVMSAPQTLVLRDYHVDNLLRLDGRTGVAACGLLDFQDAVIGPDSYDLVSLLEDARRDVAPELAGRMVRRYLAAFPARNTASFMRDYHVLGAQRASKILGIFTRLDRRDGKPAYLRHIKRVWNIFEAGCEQEPALGELADWLARRLPPERRRTPESRPAAGVLGS